MKNNTPMPEFELFNQVSANAGPVELSKVTKSIERDLVSSPKKLALSYIAGSLIGYSASLAICAQCSVGLSQFAWDNAAMLHQIPDPWCPFVCGAVFGVAPFIVTLLFFTRFQHRYLLYRMWWLMIVMPIVGGLGLTALGSDHDLMWNLQWMVTAVMTPYVCELVTGLFLKQNRWRTAQA